MKKVFLLITFLFTIFFYSGLVFADFKESDWQFKRDINLTSIVSSKKLAAFVLDNKVFEGANNNLSDLRIIDSNGKEAAYKLTFEQLSTSLQTFPVRITDLGQLSDQYTHFVLDIGRFGETHNSVTLQTTSVDFRKKVEVEASDDGKSWFIIKKAEEGGVIYDYSKDFKAQNTTINYPDSTYRFLRVKIIDNGEEPIKLTGATIFQNVKSTAREITYQPKLLSSTQDQEKKASIYILDLGARSVPSNSVAYKSSDVNFNREVMIDGSNDNKNWVFVGRDAIFYYETPKFIGGKNNIDFPEANFRYLRLTILNRDNQQINLSGFTASGISRKVLFLAEPGNQYRLYYGSRSASFPDYDLESYFKYLDDENIVNAVVGLESANEHYTGPKIPEKPLTERYPNLLNLTLGFLVLILGVFVFRLLFQVKRMQRSGK